MDTLFWRITAWAMIGAVLCLAWALSGRPDVTLASSAQAQTVLTHPSDVVTTTNAAGNVLFVWSNVDSESARVRVHSADSLGAPNYHR